MKTARPGALYALVSPELMKSARQKAKRERWSMSEVIRRLLQLWLAGKVTIEGEAS